MNNHNNKINISFRQSLGLLYPYAKKRVIEQVKSISLIIIYLILFQILILGLPVLKILPITIGIFLVIIGLAFFLEGLVLGLMPLGEICGVKLPQKTILPVILIFAFILGLGATFAEPAIGVLKAAGISIKPWEAPLLFLLLNKYSFFLVISVGIGVGLAVLFGVLRFIYNWSLKPFIFIIIPILLSISIYCLFDKNLISIVGLAWDCGGITTGPVTVPLVLALGIGISRVYANKDGGVASGFGVVTLASAFPIFTVLLLGIILNNQIIQPTSEKEFYKAENLTKILNLFNDEDDLLSYTITNSSTESIDSFFKNSQKDKFSFFNKLANDEIMRKKYFISNSSFISVIEKTFEKHEEIKLITSLNLNSKKDQNKKESVVINTLLKNFMLAFQAILPLSLFLLFVLFLMREKIRYFDEIILGILFALIGMTFFNIGITFGLSDLGNQVGNKLPSSFKTIELEDQKVTINNFDKNLLFESIDKDGNKEKFFYSKQDDKYITLSYEEKNYDNEKKQYTYIPKKGPANERYGYVLGIIIVIIFAFIMGYGATLAEPALNALGTTLENLSVGAFKKSLLIQSVSIGVGIGIAFGVAKIIWNIPLVYIITIPYIVLLILTNISNEDFVNIAWDSAGVTTGPITVPLVVSLGLGIGSNIGVVEGFGILACASAFPILSVLIVGLFVSLRRKKYIEEEKKEIF